MTARNDHCPGTIVSVLTDTGMNVSWAVMSLVSAPPRQHRPVPTLVTEAGQWSAGHELARRLPADAPVDGALVALVERTRILPPAVRDALAGLALDAGPAGALLLRGLPTGTLPDTPATPTSAATKDRVSELILLAVARSLGEPVGYRPEHGGALVQNLLPVRATAGTQTSTSSSVDLEFHTETAFHPHRPHYLLLTCLRSDPAARTFLCSIRELQADLGPDTRQVLTEPRFRTRVDESFGGTPEMAPGPLVPVLSGDAEAPTLVFDAELMFGIDPEAIEALDLLRTAAVHRRLAVVLEAGDLLVVDNHACIHGRSSFTARYDGSDRWLQRIFVVDELGSSAADRVGRIIDTRFT